MNIHKSYLDLEHLSNIELFYSKPEYFKQNEIILEGDEYRHAVKVMRHHLGDEIFITDGDGRIFICNINKILKENLSATIKKEFTYKNKFSGIVFCMPKLKNPERFEFALEKCTELGITNFIVFESERTISKSSRIERWHKILLSAMKQSLQSFLPKISLADSIEEIMNFKGKKFIFEQKSENIFRGLPKDIMGNNYFLFGPEGGFSQKELEIFADNELFRLADNRLRSETAIIKCASLLTSIV
jgi:16S rRNA (uracil1498-N3)-methyltransferase